MHISVRKIVCRKSRSKYSAVCFCETCLKQGRNWNRNPESGKFRDILSVIW